jgi:oligo-1,6-glucosidase
VSKIWWKEAIAYQIYPRSFKDSNNDGIGDIPGITSKIPYLKNLGIDLIWLCPVFKSPNDDNGYDISDYKDIMSEFGTMSDWEEMLEEVHRNGMKLIMDLVVNHSSDEHKWFIEACSSKKSKCRDYYIWRKGDKNGPPNNWLGCFGGSAWEYDAESGEYYLHLFSKKQPDLNWSNPELRREIFDIVKWWLDKGIDGFRMDVINCIGKDKSLLQKLPSDNPPKSALECFINNPLAHTYLKELNSKVFSKYDIVKIGETPGTNTQEAIKYTCPQNGELNMVFQFELMELDSGPLGKYDVVPWKLSDMKDIISRWQTELDGKGWNSLYLENHDQSRSVSRFGNDRQYRKESAKLLATLNLTLQGTPFIYQGEEIGMTNVDFPDISYYRDIEALNQYKQEVNIERKSPSDVLSKLKKKSRDNSRTPMQWNDKKNAGFTDAVPWIEVNPNYKNVNVENDLKSPDSVLNYYKKLIKLRKNNPVIIYGHYTLVDELKTPLFVYTRNYNNETLLVILNFSENTQQLVLPEYLDLDYFKLLIANYDIVPNDSVAPYEARVYLKNDMA